MTGGLVFCAFVLIAQILIVASVTAASARLNRPFHRLFWPRFVGLLLLLADLMVTAVTTFIWLDNIGPGWLFPSALAVTVLLAVSGSLVIRLGWEKKGRPPVLNWPRAALVVAAATAFLAAAGVFALMDLEARLDRALVKSEIAAAVTEAWPGRPARSDNALWVYDRAAWDLGSSGLFDRRPGETRAPARLPEWFRGCGAPNFDPGRPEVAAFLESRRRTLADLRRAAGLPVLYLEIDPDDLWREPIPGYYNFNSFALLLSLSARSKALAGGVEGALCEIETLAALGEQLRGIHLAAAFLKAGSAEIVRLETLEYLLARAESLPAGAVSLPVRVPDPADLTAMLRMEKAYALEFLIQGRSPAGEPGGPAGLLARFKSLIYRVFLFSHDLAYTRRAFAGLIRGAARPFPEAVSIWRTSLEALADGPEPFVLGTDLDTVLKQVIFLTRVEACRRLSALALAAGAYRAAEGRYPAGWTELVPRFLDRIPADPFDGQPLKIRPLPGGLDLFSLGPPAGLAPPETAGPVHFYLGAGPYEEYRVKPAGGTKP
ncbi:MAG: hypothetical protein AB1896_03325 [Thermodesulfobacteriota bacterium]